MDAPKKQTTAAGSSFTLAVISV